MISKECVRCGINRTLEEFPRDRNNKDGRRGRCKLCLSKNPPPALNIEIIEEKEGHKICSKCEVEKPFSDFSKSKTKRHGIQASCRSCQKKYRRKYNKKNKEEINQKAAKNYQSRIDYYREYRRDYFQDNKEERNQYAKDRRDSDPLYRTSYRLRAILRNAFREKGYSKKTKSYKILGASFEDVKAHLEDNPYGFMVGDEGIDIDHIVPVATANTEEELIKLNHYTNLQLLPSDYNRYVKSDREFNREDFEEWWLSKIDAA